jgi:hypothetical protein
MRGAFEWAGSRAERASRAWRGVPMIAWTWGAIAIGIACQSLGRPRLGLAIEGVMLVLALLVVVAGIAYATVRFRRS